MAGLGANLDTFLKKGTAFLAGALSLATAFLAFVEKLRGSSTFAITALLLVSSAAAFVACVVVSLGREPPRIDGGRGLLRYPRFRRVTLPLMVLIPAVWLAAAVRHSLPGEKFPAKFTVLVAEIAGPEPDRYRVTETVLAKLRSVMAPFREVSVVALGRPILEAQGAAVARQEGDKHAARVIIWGWYGVTNTTVQLSVHCELKGLPRFVPAVGSGRPGEPYRFPISALDSFSLQNSLSSGVAYLILATAGAIQYLRGDFIGAIIFLGDALRAAPDLTPTDTFAVRWFLGQAYQFVGDCRKAIQQYDAVLTFLPESQSAHTNRGVAHFACGDTERAFADFDAAVHLPGTRAGLVIALVDRAEVWRKKGDDASAVADIEAATALDPTSPAALSARGLMHYRRCELTLADRDFAAVADHCPTCLDALLLRADVRAKLGDYYQAIAYSTKALQSDPGFADAYLVRAVAYIKAGTPEKALADLDRAILLNPSNAVAWNYRAHLLQERGAFDRALSDYDHAVQLHSDPQMRGQNYSNRGYVYLSKNDDRRALADFEFALRLSPTLSFAQLGRGIALARLDRREEAIEALEGFLRLNPEKKALDFATDLIRQLQTSSRQAAPASGQIPSPTKTGPQPNPPVPVPLPVPPWR